MSSLRRRCASTPRASLATGPDSEWRKRHSEHDSFIRWRLQRKKRTRLGAFCVGGATRNRTGDEGFADLCLTAWLWRRIQYPPIIPHIQGFVKTFLKNSLKKISILFARAEPRFVPNVYANRNSPCTKLSAIPHSGTAEGFIAGKSVPYENAHSNEWAFSYGADYGARTRHLRLGKATLYQMS